MRLQSNALLNFYFHCFYTSVSVSRAVVTIVQQMIFTAQSGLAEVVLIVYSMGLIFSNDCVDKDYCLNSCTQDSNKDHHFALLTFTFSREL